MEVRKRDRILAVSLGAEHTVARGVQGSYTWGANAVGQLGVPGATGVGPFPLRTRVDDVCCGRFHTVALADSGVVCWGSNHRGQCGQQYPVQDVHTPTRVPLAEGSRGGAEGSPPGSE